MIGLHKDKAIMLARYIPNPKSSTFTKKLDGRFGTSGISGSLSKHFDQSEHMKREKSMYDLFQHGDQLLFEREKRRLLEIENKMHANNQRRSLEYKSARLIQKVGVAYMRRRRQYLADVLTQYFEVLYNRQSLTRATKANTIIIAFLTRIVRQRRLLRRIMTKTFWRQISETSIIQARDKIIEEEARLVREAQAAEALRLENERIALLRERARAQMANNTLGLKLPLNGKGNSKSSGYRSKYGNRSQGGNNANNRRGVNNSNNNNSATSITNAGMSTARSGVSSARSGNSRPGSVEPARRKEGGFNVRVAFSEDEAETNYFHDPTDENADTDHMQNSSGINRNREKSYISIHGEILNTDDTNFTSTLSSINLDLADNSVVNPLQIGISNTSMGSGDELQLKQLSDTQTKNAVEADAVSDIDDNNDEMRYGSRKRIPLDFERNERLYDLIRERKEIAFRSSQIAQDRERLLSMQKEDEEQMHIEQRQLRREDIIGRILRQEESPERIKRRRRKKSSQLSASRKLHSASDSCIGNNIDSTNLNPNPNRLGEEVSEHLSRPTTAQSVERSTQTEVSRLLWHPQRRSQKKIETVLPVDRPESEVEQCIDTIDDDTNPTITKTNPPYVSVKIRKQKSLQLFESRQAKVDAAILTEQAKEKRHELAKAAREIMNKCKKRPIELKPVITPGSGRSSSQASITQPDRETSSETGNSDETSKPNDSDCNSPSKANRNMKCLPPVEIDINQQQLRDLKKVNPVKSRQKHNIMNRNHNNSSTLKAPAELPDIRITNNANKLVEMILHDILSASCQHNNTITPSRTSNVDNIDTVSDKVVVDSDIQSQTQFNFSEFIDSTSVQSLSVQSQHHQRPNKQMSEKAPSVITNTDTNTNNNIRRVLGQKLAVTKKLISGPSSSPYHPNHKTPPARLQSNPTSKPSTTTSTADIAILAAITAFQHSNLQHPLLVENQDTASLKQTESSTGDTIVDQKNVHDSTLEKHLTKKIERISKQAKSPLKKKKNPVQELLDVIIMARLNQENNINRSSTEKPPIVNEQVVNIPSSDTESTPNTDILPLLRQLYEQQQQCLNDESDDKQPVRPCHAITHTRLPSPYTAARIRARVSIQTYSSTTELVDSSPNNNDDIVPNKEHIRAATDHQSSTVEVSSPTATRALGKAHTALSEGLNRLGPPPEITFLSATINTLSSNLDNTASKHVSQSAIIRKNKENMFSSNGKSEEMLVSNSSQESAKVHEEEQNITDTASMAESNKHPDLISSPGHLTKIVHSEDHFPEEKNFDSETSVNIPPPPPPPPPSSLSSDVPFSLYSHQSFRLTETCEDEDDDDEDEDEDDQFRNIPTHHSSEVGGLYYDYLPTSNNDSDIQTSATSVNCSSSGKNNNYISKNSMKRPPVEQDDELRKIKYDINEKLKNIDK